MLNLQLQESKNKKTDLLAGDWREATLGSNQLQGFNPESSRRVRSERLGRIEAPAEEASHGEDGVLSFVENGGWSELSTESDVAVQGFFGGDDTFWSYHLVFHSLHTQPTEPPTLVPLTHPRDVRRGAFLCEPARVAFHALHFHLRHNFQWGRTLSLWPWNCHALLVLPEQNLQDHTHPLSLNNDVLREEESESTQICVVLC